MFKIHVTTRSITKIILMASFSKKVEIVEVVNWKRMFQDCLINKGMCDQKQDFAKRIKILNAIFLLDMNLKCLFIWRLI